MSLVACGGGGGTDAGPRVDAPTGQDGGGYPFPDLPALEGFDESPVPAVSGRRPTYSAATLDLSCLGTLAEPAGGAMIDAELELLEFSSNPLPFAGGDSLDVWFFADNVVRDYAQVTDCVLPDCQLLRPDPEFGLATAQVRSGGWYSYSVRPRAGISPLTSALGLTQVNEPSPTTAGQRIIARWISVQNANVLNAAAGFTRLEGAGVVAGAVLDCRPGEPRLRGAIVRLFSPSGEEVFTSANTMMPQLRYFTQSGDNRSPNEDEEYTTENGLYLWAQLPPDPMPYRIEAWARRTAGGPIELIGCEEARVGADEVSAVNILPLRSDRPASCPRSP